MFVVDEICVKLKPGAESLGVTLADVTNQIRQAYFGELVYRLPREDGDVDVRVRLPEETRRNIDSLAKVDLTPVFPEGTDNDAMFGETRTLPKLWANFDGAKKKDDAFEQAAAALAAAAPNGLDALRPTVGALGGTCKGCHDEYRAKDF